MQVHILISATYVFIKNPYRRCAMKHEDFFPKGAVAFFLLMLGFYALVWLSTYLVMVSRGQTQP